MSKWAYLTSSQKLEARPCKLLSIIVGNDGTNVGWLDVFNARTSDAPHKVARLYGESKGTEQYRWEGLELDRGLYIEFVSTIEWATVEWEPVGYPKGEKSVVDYIIEAES